MYGISIVVFHIYENLRPVLNLNSLKSNLKIIFHTSINYSNSVQQMCIHVDNISQCILPVALLHLIEQPAQSFASSL